MGDKKLLHDCRTTLKKAYHINSLEEEKTEDLIMTGIMIRAAIISINKQIYGEDYFENRQKNRT